MPARGKIAQLPPEVRKEFDERLIAAAFSGYRELAEWLATRGFEVHYATVARHGAAVERKIAQIDASTRAAEALMAHNPDAEGNLAAATIKAVQSGLFDLVMASDSSVDPETLADRLTKAGRTIAEVARAGISVQRERERVLAAAEKALHREAKRRGWSGDVAAGIRAALSTV